MIKYIALALMATIALTSGVIGGETGKEVPFTLTQRTNYNYVGLKPFYAFSADSFGSEVSLGTELCDYCDIQVSASYIADTSNLWGFSADLLVYGPRFDYIEPYIIVGGGAQVDSNTAFQTRLGGGINIDVIPLNSTVLYVEGIHTIVAEGEPDYTSLGVGIKVVF